MSVLWLLIIVPVSFATGWIASTVYTNWVEYKMWYRE